MEGDQEEEHKKDGLGDIKEDINKKSLNWVDTLSGELWNDKMGW